MFLRAVIHGRSAFSKLCKQHQLAHAGSAADQMQPFGQRRIQRVFDESPCRRLPLLRVRTQVRKFCDRTEKRTLTPDRAGKPQRQTDMREQPKGLLLTEMTYKTILGILF